MGDGVLAAGVDVGTECVKVVLAGAGAAVRARSVVPTRGYFQGCVDEALRAALDDAKIAPADLTMVCATGFGAGCVSAATMSATESACHARGALQSLPGARTVVDIGGREPRVIKLDPSGVRAESRTVRRCAIGVGTFLMFSARHLDVHPTRLQELASAAASPAAITNYCSVFSGSDILERLREGATREEIALGCIRSIAERILEIGGFEDPVVVTGGVAEYFPGVLAALESLSGREVVSAPDPIFAGALGAALHALETPAARPSREERRRRTHA